MIGDIHGSSTPIQQSPPGVLDRIGARPRQGVRGRGYMCSFGMAIPKYHVQAAEVVLTTGVYEQRRHYYQYHKIPTALIGRHRSSEEPKASCGSRTLLGAIWDLDLELLEPRPYSVVAIQRGSVR